jgi:cold shock protein
MLRFNLAAISTQDFCASMRPRGSDFIQLDSGDKDVFVHISAVEKAASAGSTNAKVSYEEMENRGKASAENLRVG